MKKEDIEFLKQSAKYLKEYLSRLEIAYRNKDIEKFNLIKSQILNVQNKISNILK